MLPSMKNKTMENEAIKPIEDNSCPIKAAGKQFQRAMRMLAGKWKAEILWQLVQRKHRFGELRRAIPGITQHMLTTRLRDLEADGMVKRTVFPEVPLCVEYEITESAKALKPVFDELHRWSEEHGALLRDRSDEPETASMAVDRKSTR